MGRVVTCREELKHSSYLCPYHSCLATSRVEVVEVVVVVVVVVVMWVVVLVMLVVVVMWVLVCWCVGGQTGAAGCWLSGLTQGQDTV